MNSSKNLAAIAALAISAGLAGSGCMAQGADDATTDGQDQVAAPAQTAEQTGTASEKCGGLWGGGWGGFGGFGGCGLWGGGFPFWGGFGGCGWGGGFPFWGGLGGCGWGGGWW